MIKIKELFWKIIQSSWTIGFVSNSIDSILKGEKLKVNWIKSCYKDGWFADPFILDVTDTDIILLVEDFYYPINRGRISKLTIDKKTFELKTIDVVLELDTHLSFPAIIRKDEKIFIYPESADSGKLTLYEYKPETNECIPVSTIAQGELADAVITNVNGKDIMLATRKPMHNKNVLHLLTKQSETENYSDKCDIKFDKNIARNAGDIFTHNNNIYRPAQDCQNGYGEGVILQKITFNEDLTFGYENVTELKSDNKHYNIGLHTFNTFNDTIVIDAKGYRYGIARYLMILRNLI